MVQQHHIVLPPFSRGFHLIDEYVLKEITELPETGLLHIFILHTSAGICINENADPTVLMDFETAFNKLVPEGMEYYKHHFEGDDDMPAHIKSVMAGSSVTIPVTNGKLNLGTWQGIYLCEFRNNGVRRKLVATMIS